jgi:phosphatidylserine synthase
MKPVAGTGCSGEMDADQNNDFRPYAASAVAGFVICLAVTLASGRREAWDSAAYFSVGIPLMCAVIFVVGYRYPLRTWRWTLCMAAGQSLAIALGGGSLSLWPLAIIAMTVLSIPQFVTGLIAGQLAAKRGRR